jgi:hypothetical protein
MASFTDDPRQLGNFTPYIETLPAESLAQVGMIKQQQFDQGVQKVQGQVDMLTSLPIAKDEVKSYVQTKLGQLKEGVTKNLAGDFSDARITNQIGGAARIIARDPIVQNGVTSTARMQAAQSQMQEAIKAGKSAPQNEASLNESIGSWLNDGQIDTQFTGSYSPHVDYIDKLTKTFKDMNQGEDIDKDAFIYENGERKVNPVLFKGVGPKRIQDAWNLVSSQPDVQNQLKIDGWYRYNGVTPNELGHYLQESTQRIKDNIGQAINALKAKIAMGSTDTTLSAQIEQYKQMDIDRTKSYENINAILHGKNPESAKTELVKEQTLNDFIGAHAFQTMEKSPLWETSMQQKVFDRQFYEWQQDYNLNVDKFNLEKIKVGLKTPSDGSGGGNDVITSGQIVTSEIPQGSVAAYDNQASALDAYTQSTLELASYMAHGGNDSPAVLDNVTGKWKFNFGPDKHYKTLGEAQGAVGGLLATAKDDYMNGAVDNARANELIEASNQKWDNYQSNSQIVKDVETQFKPKIDEIKKKIGNEEYASAYIVDNKLPGWQVEQAKLEGKYGAGILEDQPGSQITSSTRTPAWKIGMGISEIGHYATSGNVKIQRGPNASVYEKAISTVKNDPSITQAVKDREDAFSARNKTDIPYTVTHDVSKSDDREYINTRFYALAAARAVNPSTGKGDANEILNLTGQDKNKRGELQYQSGIDPQSGVAYIKVGSGTDFYTMEVSRAEYEKQFPERKYNNQFRETFGPRLNQTQWQSTDPLGESNGGGRANAYKVVLDKPSAPFVVQYHLVAQGPNQYAMRLWVTPKPTSTNPSPDPVINGEYASGTLIGMPSTLTEEEVVKWKDKLKDSDWLNQQLLYKFKPKAP